MKKIFLGSTLALIVILILKASGVLDALLLFILIGALPGTTHALSPSMTLAILTIMTAVLIGSIAPPSFHDLLERRGSHSASSPSKAQRRRYSKL